MTKVDDALLKASKEKDLTYFSEQWLAITPKTNFDPKPVFVFIPVIMPQKKQQRRREMILIEF